MRWASIFALFLAAILAVAHSRDLDLAGLWEAKRDFGPEVRGLLTLMPRDGGVVADIAGYAVPVRVSGRERAFELPDGRGAFRGKVMGGEIHGFWIQSPSPISGLPYSTPVTLRKAGE